VVFAPLLAAEALLGDENAPGAVDYVFLTDDSDVRDFFPVVARRQIRRFCHPDFLRDEATLRRLIEPAGIGAAGSVAPLSRYCAAAAAPEQRTIERESGRRRMVRLICKTAEASSFASYRDGEHRLALEEMVNNAIFHGFVEADGRPRYSADAGNYLTGEDRVTIQFHADRSVLAFSVADNGGRLDADTVRAQVDAQLRGHGLFEAAGRGIFLTFALANAFIVRSAPGRFTQVIVIFHADRPRSQKLFVAD
jgi:anti-sigma regulatory factor (Ser/Thr protein kinase)